MELARCWLAGVVGTLRYPTSAADRFWRRFLIEPLFGGGIIIMPPTPPTPLDDETTTVCFGYINENTQFLTKIAQFECNGHHIIYLNVIGRSPGFVNFMMVMLIVVVRLWWRLRNARSTVSCRRNSRLSAAHSEEIAERLRRFLDSNVQRTNPQEAQIFFCFIRK